MILVIGGGSKIGSRLIDLLVKQGEDVRAVVRDSEAPIADGVESVVGDLAHLGRPASSLDRLLSEMTV